MRQQQIRLEIEEALRHQDTEDENVILDKLSELCSRYPNQSETWLEYALSLDRLSKEEEAIPNYKRALELGLDDDQERVALICLASSYRNIGEIDEALKTISQARQRFHENAIVECFYALILHDAGLSSKAISTLGLTLLREANPETLQGFEKALEYKFNDLVNEH